MAPPSISEFKAEFPEFATLTDAVITSAIARACRFHTDQKAGTLYAAAHLHAIDQEKKNQDGTISADGKVDGGAGVVTEEEIGDRSVSYMDGAGGEERRVFWQRTPYGREFLKIEERNPRQAFGMLVV